MTDVSEHEGTLRLKEERHENGTYHFVSCCDGKPYVPDDIVQRLISEAVQAEREACARVATNKAAQFKQPGEDDWERGFMGAAASIAAAIRNRRD